MREFSEKNPKFAADNRVKYPIEDTLFDKFPELLKDKDYSKPKPPAKTDFIPPQFLGDILKISHFFEKFDELIDGPEFSKEELYVAIMYEGEERMELIHDIHIALLYLFLDEFEENKKYDNPKESNQGQLLYLLRNANEGFCEAHVRIFWPELFLCLTEVSEYEYFFPEETLAIVKDITTVGVVGYNKIEPVNKLNALSWLIEAVYELNSFRTHLQGLVEKQVEKSRAKGKLIEEIKKIEIELKVIREKADAQTLKVRTEEEIKKSLSRIEGQKRDKEINDMKTELYKFESQLSKEEMKLAKLNKEYKACKGQAKFLIHPSVLLGYDKDRVQYWYFYQDPKRLWVQKSPSGEPTLWFSYSSREEVLELRNSLNINGVREKALASQLDHYLNDELFEFERMKAKANGMDLEDHTEKEKEKLLKTDPNVPAPNGEEGNFGGMLEYGEEGPGGEKMDAEVVPTHVEVDPYEEKYNEILDELWDYESMYAAADPHKKPKTRNTKVVFDLIDEFRM